MKFNKFLKYVLEYILLVSIAFIFRLIPFSINLKFAKILGKLFFKLNKKHRLRAIENLTYSFPEKDQNEIVDICRKMYINLVKVYMEFLFLPKFNKKFKLVGKENLEKALNENKGIVAITSHLDNWELLGTSLVHFGFPVDAIYHPMKNPYSDKFFYNIRRKAGMTLISMNNSLRPSLQALKNNHLLGLIADQDAGRDGVFVDFFNRPASTGKGPALFALKTGSPMIFFAMVRDESDNHIIYIGKPFKLKITGNLKEDIYNNTKLWSNELQSWVRKYPEQWFWVHRKWQTKIK